MIAAGPRIGFIGAGRLGRALAWSLAGAGLRVTHAASRTPAGAQALADGISGCEAAPAQAVVDRCELVFVTTPDAAITPTVDALRWRPGVAVVHCSGVTEIAALGKAAAEGACTGGFHPMQTFGDPQAAMRSLPGCTVTIEAGPPLEATLVEIAARLGCPVNRLPPGMRGLYHAAAGCTSQFVNVLFDEAARLWRAWGAAEGDAVRALLPLARGTLAAIEAAGIAGGMPGPVSRGDVSSIGKHLAALDALGGPQHLALYRALCARTVAIAERGRRITPEAAQAFDALLGAPPPSLPTTNLRRGTA